MLKYRPCALIPPSDLFIGCFDPFIGFIDVLLVLFDRFLPFFNLVLSPFDLLIVLGANETVTSTILHISLIQP